MSETTWLLAGRLGVKVGDITGERMDAIVNAANSSLMGGGGVDGAIHRKGGPAILSACRRVRKERYPEGLPTGQAVATESGNLPCRYVIHTVGPVWSGGNSGEAGKLTDAYTMSLRVAEELGLNAVAFPSISTGVYGYPKEKAARTSFSAVEAFLAHAELPQKVYFVFFSTGDRELFLESMKA